MPLSGEGGAPMAHIYGDRSAIIIRHKEMGRGLDMIPASAPRVVLPDSEHHVMVDQPLALVAAMRAILATWP
jgi:pimeloyl-ACP methyl ester carboxylesterase